ncbi:MAG: IS607 family transposase [Promethearchaeota archaeon]
MFISIGKAAWLLGVSPNTLRRWDKLKKIVPTYRTPGHHRRYKLTILLEYTNQLSTNSKTPSHLKRPPSRVVIYGRVSGSKQRRDLEAQLTHLQTYVATHNWQLLKTYRDIGAGLNEHRRGLLQLLRDLPVLRPDLIICTYEDRLTRFGVTLLETMCTYFSTRIHVTQKKKTLPTLEEQVVKDVIALITSFAGKLHRARRGQFQ